MKLVRFTGDEDRPTPSRGAIHQGGDLWLVQSEDAQLSVGAVELSGATARDAVPLRTDLPRGHPLHGQRALVSVPAGSPDITVDDQGELVVGAGDVSIDV